MSDDLKPKNLRAFAALDDLGRAYVVFEPVETPSRLIVEAFALADGAGPARAAEIAADFNATASYIFRGGPPLTGDQIPTLHRLPEDEA